MTFTFETEEQEEAMALTMANEMSFFIHELSNIRKKYLKYRENTEEEDKVLVEVWDDIFNEINNRNLSQFL